MKGRSNCGKKEILRSLRRRQNANPERIKAAYAPAIKFHPDKNPGDKNAESQFQSNQQAYEVLF